MTTKDRNRNKFKVSHGRSSWCFGCDRDRVHDGEKCSTCGYYQRPKRFKAGKFVPLIKDYDFE